MKKSILFLTGLTLAWLAGPGMNHASAQIYATDTAAIYNTWTNNENFGMGFTPWVLGSTNSGSGSFSGFFIGSSDDGGQQGMTGGYIDTSGNSFGIYANGNGAPAAFAYRGLSNALAPNEVFKVSFQNTYIQNNGVMGFALRTDNNTNFQDASILADPNTAFAFYFAGGNGDYYIYDNGGAGDSGIGFTTSGFVVEFYQLSAGQYELIILSANGGAVLGSYPVSTLAGGGSSPIITFVGFNIQSGGNQNAYFNSLEQASVTVVPPSISNLTPTNGSIYVTGGSQLSFNVSSMFSNISSNGISLTLNGVNETNQMSFTGSGTTNVQVTLNPALQANVLYNGTIVASDVNGNLVTNSFSFNTWLPELNNIYIEASDYNYQGGDWINNFTTAEPNQNSGQHDLQGVQGIDYYVYNLQETNVASPYRMGDYPFLEPATDVDHDNFSSDGFTPYDLGYNEVNQWEDYTRELSNNVTYAVYARVSGFNGGVISMERMATAEVSTANQPGATLGQFNVPTTGAAQNWTFVPLTDFFSNPVLINSGGTNTFRITDIDGNGSYNISYMILVAVTNTATLRPYITSGVPYPGLAGVGPEQPVSFTIANRQTSVTPSSIQFFLNGSNLTSQVTLSNNAAGTVVSYQPLYPNLLAAGSNSEEVIFSDGSVMQTDTWNWTVWSLPTIPASWALPLTGSYSRGISEQIAKADDSSSSADFPASLARAEAQLAGTLTNSMTELPYTNEAFNNGMYIEPNTINYALSSTYIGLFNPTNPFPDIPVGGSNDVALAANMYVYLTPGAYNFNVYSDDGFQFSAGPAAPATNTILDAYNGGRAPGNTSFSFIVTTNGLYPMQLIYYKAQAGGGGVELFSVNQTNEASVLLNDTNTVGSVAVYYQTVSTAPTLSISTSGSNVVLSWTDPTYSLQSAPAVTGPYTTINAAASPYHYAISGAQEYFRLAK